MTNEPLTYSDPAVVEAVRTLAVTAPEPDDGYAAHAAYVQTARTEVREALALLETKLMGIRADIGQLGEIDCGGDCCGASSDRRYALEFVEQAERSAAAARGLLRHAWREDGAQ